MDANTFREFCLSLPGAYDATPFVDKKSGTYDSISVFYVAGKWFGFVDMQKFEFCNLKSLPPDTEYLTQTYAGIKPGWHMNKRHWISVYFYSDVSDELIFELVRKAYQAVVAKLPKKEREKIADLTKAKIEKIKQ